MHIRSGNLVAVKLVAAVLDDVTENVERSTFPPLSTERNSMWSIGAPVESDFKARLSGSFIILLAFQSTMIPSIDEGSG